MFEWFKKLLAWFRPTQRIRTITILNLKCSKCKNNTFHQASILTIFLVREHSQPAGIMMTTVCMNCGEVGNAKFKLT